MAALVWAKTRNEFDQPIRVAESDSGRFTIDGNNYGRNRWTVTYPTGDYGMVDTLREAIEWAELWLLDAQAALAARSTAGDDPDWRNKARYADNVALTYLEDAPAGRGPWFVVTVNKVVLETADYPAALAEFESRAA